MQTTKVYYEPLPEVVQPRGTGIQNLQAHQLRRNGKLCLYERSDNVWEVFIVQTMEETIFNGVVYPAHELYPGNESFGSTAWCFSNKEKVIERYEKLLTFNQHLK